MLNNPLSLIASGIESLTGVVPTPQQIAGLAGLIQVVELALFDAGSAIAWLGSATLLPAAASVPVVIPAMGGDEVSGAVSALFGQWGAEAVSAVNSVAAGLITQGQAITDLGGANRRRACSGDQGTAPVWVPGANRPCAARLWLVTPSEL